MVTVVTVILNTSFLSFFPFSGGLLFIFFSSCSFFFLGALRGLRFFFFSAVRALLPPLSILPNLKKYFSKKYLLPPPKSGYSGNSYLVHFVPFVFHILFLVVYIFPFFVFFLLPWCSSWFKVFLFLRGYLYGIRGTQNKINLIAFLCALCDLVVNPFLFVFACFRTGRVFLRVAWWFKV